MDQNRENLFNYIMRNVRWLTVSQLLTLMLEVVREMQFREPSQHGSVAEFGD